LGDRQRKDNHLRTLFGNCAKKKGGGWFLKRRGKRKKGGGLAFHVPFRSR